MKNDETILKELNKILLNVFQNNTIEINPNTTAADIKEWDSLNHMHLIAEIESHFNCEFSFDEVVNFKNVGGVIIAIQNKDA